MSTSNVKTALMAAKLKEGVQDTIVYLRMLEGAKLAPVYERKRKHLMEQLLDLQGDTLREAPPKLDSDSEDELEVPDPSSPVKKRDHPADKPAKVSDRMSKFEKPGGSGGGRNFQYKTLEQLKKRNSLSMEDKPKEKTETSPVHSPTISEEKTEASKTDATTTDKVDDAALVDSLTVVKQQGGSSSPAGTPDTKRKNRGLGLLNKVKPKKKERSATMESTSSTDTCNEEKTAPAPPPEPEVTEPPPPVSPPSDTTNQSLKQSDSVVEELAEEDEGDSNQPFSSLLEKVSKRLGRYTYQKIEMQLLEETVRFWKQSQSQDKSTVIQLVGAASAVRDTYQFELHTPDKSYTFRAETETLCSKWVTMLGEAIDRCNPIEEEPIVEEGSVSDNKTASDSTIPQISVSSSQEASPEKQPPPPSNSSNMRASVSYENFSPGVLKKGKKEMPDISTAKVKGYMYRKGTFSKWEKIWMGLFSDNVLYITTNETNKKVQGSITITQDTKIEKRKGTDKLPHALCVINKGKDTFATDSLPDFSMWIYCLEQASAGPNDIQELLSEDEDDGELYEELGAGEGFAPDLPSPRPPPSPRITRPPVPVEEEVYDGFDDDGDIYEGLDEVELPPHIPQQKPPPISSLPPSRGSNDHAPVLPPRNAPPPQVPNLPPRPPKSSDFVPTDYEAPRPSPPTKKKVEEIDDDVYDDVLAAQMNDDVMDETYDDVETVLPPSGRVNGRGNTMTKEVSSSELYEDMVPEPAGIELDEDEEYSDMTLGGPVEPEDDDLYDDVSGPPPPRPPPPKAAASPLTVSSKATTPSVASVKSPPIAKVTTPTGRPTTPTGKGVPTGKGTPTSKTTTLTVTKPAAALGKQTPPTKQSSLTPDLKPKSAPTGTNTRPNSAGAKRLNTTGKVAQMSKMFGQNEDTSQKDSKATPLKDSKATPLKDSKATPTKKVGELMYKSPGKAVYSSNHCILENGIMIFYKTASDKLSHYRLSLRDAGLKIASHDKEVSKFTFNILKGTVTHSFYVPNKEEFVNWISALVTSTQKVCPEKEDLYHAPQDYNGTGDQISFKKDAILWIILRDSASEWTGIVGTSDSSFTNTVGSFPKGCVDALTNEDVYI